MDFDLVLGTALGLLALGGIVFLTLWSRRNIERIHRRSLQSLREIQKDKGNG